MALKGTDTFVCPIMAQKWEIMDTIQELKNVTSFWVSVPSGISNKQKIMMQQITCMEKK